MMSLEVHAMAIDASRKNLDARAARGWDIEQARAAERSSSLRSARFRWSVVPALLRVRNGRQDASQQAFPLSASVAS